MGLFGDDQGKTEKATPSRLAEVRNRGDSPLSRELVQGGVLLVAAIVLGWIGEWLIDALGQLLRRGLTIDLAEHQVTDVGGICRELLAMVGIVGPPFATLVVTLVVATLLIGYGQIGVHWSREVIGFKLQRLNPLTNMNRLFNAQALVKTGFAAIKLTMLVTIVWMVIGDRIPGLLHLHEQPFATAAGEIADLGLTIMLWVGAFVTALAAADWFWQPFVNGDLERRVPHNLNMSFNFVEGESLIMGVKGIAVSSGSACTSASLEPSYVLRALGRSDELAHSSLRMTIGRFTTEAEIDYAVKTLQEQVAKLRELSPLWEMYKDGVDLNTIQWAAH